MCNFCSGDHETEQHVCLFCGLRGLHTFKNCYLKCINCEKKLEIITGLPVCYFCDNN